MEGTIKAEKHLGNFQNKKQSEAHLPYAAKVYADFKANQYGKVAAECPPEDADLVLEYTYSVGKSVVTAKVKVNTFYFAFVDKKKGK